MDDSPFSLSDTAKDQTPDPPTKPRSHGNRRRFEIAVFILSVLWWGFAWVFVSLHLISLIDLVFGQLDWWWLVLFWVAGGIFCGYVVWFTCYFSLGIFWEPPEENGLDSFRPKPPPDESSPRI